jgi:transcriptional regulatory protein LevR
MVFLGREIEEVGHILQGLQEKLTMVVEEAVAPGVLVVIQCMVEAVKVVRD